VALQPNLVKACWRRSLDVCLSWAQCVQSLTPRARLSLFTLSAHLDFGLPWFLLPLGLALNRAISGRSSDLLIMWPASSQIRAIGQHPRLTAVEQDWADQGLVNGELWLDCRCLRSPKKHLFAVWILRCISRLTSFVGVIRDTSVCRQWPRYATRHKSSFHSGLQSYILSFVHLFLTLLWLLLFPMLSKHPERLTDSYRRYLYHRHMRVVMFLCCRLCRLFVGLLVVR
jgi:hypothetical protein